MSIMAIQQFTLSQTLDSSYVSFEVRDFGIRTVNGTFSNFSGKSNWDAQQLNASFFNICIDASTINTNNSKRDEHLRSADYFDVANYPLICFVSKKIIPLEADTTKYKLVGDMTIHGITHEVEGILTMENGGIQVKFTIKRYAFGIGNKGGFAIGKDVNVVVYYKI